MPMTIVFNEHNQDEKSINYYASSSLMSPESLPVLGTIEQGQLVLRGDLEEADDMLQKTLSRTNRINEIVGSEYLPRRDEVFNF